MKQSEALSQQLLSIYNYLHEHPEVSWQEHETTDYLVHFLERLGLSPVRLKGCTGLYVEELLVLVYVRIWMHYGKR